ncbi:MAG TPA: hypothetical protein VFX45_12505 [Solirubrobacterales bacterium]|nr:hypothetical protein [Solirubrobacterales bacterium]
MTRKLKASLLAFVALSAIGAVGATAAQAGEFTSDSYPATNTGQNVGGTHVFTTSAGMMNCNVTFHGEMAAASGEVTLTPTYNCGIGGNQVDVDMNGCDYAFHAGETAAMDVVMGSMDIKCPEGAVINFEITSMVTCNITVGEQLGLIAVTYTNKTGTKDVLVDMNLNGIDYTADFGCPGAGMHNNGTYMGTTTLKADNEGTDAFMAE